MSMDAHARRLLNVPEIEETQQLILRVPRPGDGQDIHLAKEDSFVRLREWFPWAQELGTYEEEELFARFQYAEFWNRNSVGRLIFEKNTNEFIGSVGLHGRKWDPVILEIGYWLRTGYEGKGYMSEAVQACLQTGFNIYGANKIIIRADSRNQRSQNVALRNGFTLDGVMRHYEPVHKDPQRMTDMCFFSLMRKDYEQRRNA